MKLTATMVDLEGGTASLGLFGEIGDDGTRPPHVQVTVSIPMDGDATAIRRRAIEHAIAAMDEARSALLAEN